MDPNQNSLAFWAIPQIRVHTAADPAFGYLFYFFNRIGNFIPFHDERSVKGGTPDSPSFSIIESY
jgi:hypothetical protein